METTFKKIDGVEMAEVNYGTETAKINFDENKTNPQHLSEAVKKLGYSLEEESAEAMGMSVGEHSEHLGLNQSKQDKVKELNELKVKVITAIPLAVISIIIMVLEILSGYKIITPLSEIWMEFFHHLLPVMATYMLLVVGKPYLLGVYRFLRYGQANMDTLIGIGTSAAFIYSFIITAFEESLTGLLNVENTYYDVAIVVIAFITLGKYLEAKSKLKTGEAIQSLLNLGAKTALVRRGTEEKEIPVNEVTPGDLVIVKPGGKIAVDGVVIEGASFVDESMNTGEPMPVQKKIDDQVVAGTLNTSGSFIFRATKVGKETLLAQIIKMVENAQASRAPIQALADKISGVFVPVVLALAFLTLALWLIIGTNYLGFAQALSFGLSSFVGILVIACPCALGLATPTAIIVGVGKGARAGILIKDATTLQKLHKVDTIVFDKTGTITKGKPELVSVKNYSKESEEKIVGLLATLESRSEHPLAEAVLREAKKRNLTLEKVENFESLKGKGLRGKIADSEYFAGNLKLLAELKLNFNTNEIETATRRGQTPIILATTREVLAVIMVADAIKPESRDAIKNLHQLGLKTVMLTGDHHNTAEAIAREVGIDEVLAEILPADKLAKIKALQTAGHIVAMAGDGVNDAPALAQAEVGIAMGTGTDVAIETAGITLLGGDIAKIAQAIKLSRITMRGIKQNLFWAFVYNLIGIPLAAGAFYPIFGWLLNPVFAGFAMAASSVSVVGNSLRIKAKKL
ncbi:MAG: heavy metal translocating P-type ATPase [Patescibacteria group bacterium]